MLIEPHGGTLVNRFASDPEQLKQQLQTLPGVPVSAADLSTVYRIADGTLSPLEGPMNQREYEHVLDTHTISRNGKTLAWAIPLAFPVTADLAGKLAAGQKVALTNPAGEPVALLEVESVFAWDKPRYLKSVYLTERTDHPGADMVLKNDADKSHLVGGKLTVLPQPKNPHFGKYVLKPAEVRKLLESKGWDAAVAFQTRNPLHRAHEYALLYGLEVLLGQGKNAGAVLNPLVGETKGDDVSAEIRMQTYEKLIESGEFGEGDKNAKLWAKVGGSIKDRVLLLGLDIKMFYGGPSEAIMHAIYRQNMGYTHLIIGRKHADAPYHDGTAIWGDFDAQEIFDQLGGAELKIKPVRVGFAAYYESIGRVDLMENHKDEKPVFISGKQVRATLQQGEDVDPRIMRPSTSHILAAAMKQG
ncbi:MAG: sulfate adenylyltransferase [Phycisphaeraceae bacterium]|nr:sulfate adenylyltransferase [Phycisphaeraceae bacterium]